MEQATEVRQERVELGVPAALRPGDSHVAQAKGLRARCFDEEVRRFLLANPDGTVVAFGEGLDARFERVDNGRVGWVSVDLPETISERLRLPPQSERQQLIAGSALDTSWLEAVDPTGGVMLTAQDLTMYLQPAQVENLIGTWTERLPGSTILFDALGLGAGDERRLRKLPGVAELQRLRTPRGRGLSHGVLLPLAAAAPGLRRSLPAVIRVSAR